MMAEEQGDAAPLLAYSSSSNKKALYNRIILHLVPFFFTLGLLSFLDRTNVSLAGSSFRQDLGLSQSEYGMGVSLFFVTYILFQIPSNAILKRLGTPVWVGIILLGWGMTASTMAFAKTPMHFYILRLLLGLFEAGTYPATYYYLALFFPQHIISLPISLSMSGLSVGMALSGPVADLLLRMDGALGWKGWQWMFFLEGPPAILLAICTFFLLPKGPESASFLSDSDRALLSADACLKENVHNKPTAAYLFQTIVLNKHLLFMLFAFFFGGMMGYVVAFWMPMWIESVLFDGGSLVYNPEKKMSAISDSKIALMTVIPYTSSVVIMCVVGWTSVKLNDRKFHAGVLAISAGILGMMFPSLAQISAVLGIALLSLIAATGSAVIAPVTALQLSYMNDANKAFGVAWMNAWGNICGLTGPIMAGHLIDATKEFSSSIYAVSAGSIFSGLLYMVMRDDLRKRMINSE